MRRGASDPMTTEKFVRKEKEHLRVLQGRLDWLRSDRARQHPGGFTEENGFFQGEAYALAWALAVIEGTIEPLEVRVERWEKKMRVVEARLGRLEDQFEDDD